MLETIEVDTGAEVSVIEEKLYEELKGRGDKMFFTCRGSIDSVGNEGGKFNRK